MKVAFYKGTRSGLAGLYSIGVKSWTRSKYSHAEIVFSDGMAASSSFADGGVRFKHIDFDPAKWDFIEITGDESKARKWFVSHEGKAYDIIGNVGFVIGLIRDGSDKWSCAESIAAALGYLEPWRFSPAILYSACSYYRRKNTFNSRK